MPLLHSQISELGRIGKLAAKRFKKLGLETVQDLILYYPYRYERFGEAKLIKDLKEGESASLRLEIELIQNKRSFKKRMYITEALAKDESGEIKLVWFNQPFIAKNVKVGDHLSVAGKVSGHYGQLSLNSPVFEKINREDKELIHTSGITPIYSTTYKLSQKQIRFLMSQSVKLAKEIKDWLPKDIRKKLELLDLPQALYYIHFPKNEEELREAKRRLSFAELFLRQLKAQGLKQQAKKIPAVSLSFQEKTIKNFVSSLPFALTPDQKKAAWEIIQDLEKDKPMSRLLEGDVGSGKTLVALMAMVNCALNQNNQAVLMAPTEILSQQHYENAKKLCQNIPGIKLGLICRSRQEATFPLSGPKKNLGPQIAQEANIIIGTHALIQEKIKIPNLALMIVDEQHRFGVEQRKKLLEVKRKKQNLAPHFLSMTATPIPRSLALAIYGDLDVSLLKTKPAKRRPIISKVVEEKNRARAYDFIRGQIKAGYQAFVVCPLIDPSDKLGVKSVKEEYEKLDKQVFPELKLGLLHGKMKAEEKEKVMRDFQEKKTQILISTSVIEVGIDIPNASIMMIEGAERFGLAQLHQFRGRVGRGEAQSYCFLFMSSPDSGPSFNQEKSLQRLKFLEAHQDGFELAKEDLKLRGSGEVYGTIQSGFPELKIASLFDYELIKKAQEEAEALVIKDPELKKYPELRKKLGDWEKSIHLE